MFNSLIRHYSTHSVGFSLDVEGLSCYAFPLKLSKSKHGCGCLIKNRHILKQYVSFLKNMYDTVIWLKFDRYLFI